MVKKDFDVCIVGNGIASWTLQYYLNELDLNVLVIDSHDDYFNNCSMNSTAINCLRGTSRGISPLGDLLVDSFEEFQSFIRSNKLEGIEQGSEYQLFSEKTLEKWSKRYPNYQKTNQNEFLLNKIKDFQFFNENEAYFIDVNSLKNSLLCNSSVLVKDLVISINKDNKGYEVKTKTNQYHSNFVITCSNYATKYISNLGTKDFKYYLEHCKPVLGQYLELRNACDYNFEFTNSFNIALEQFHFIYRKSEDLIQIGSYSENNSSDLFDKTNMLKELYCTVSKSLTFEIPEFNKFSIKKGIRHKGHKRLPYWGTVDGEKLFAICGLYKNGFTFSFLAAKEISQKIIKKSSL